MEAELRVNGRDVETSVSLWDRLNHEKRPSGCVEFASAEPGDTELGPADWVVLPLLREALRDDGPDLR